MPVPREHMERLETQLSAHEAELETLRHRIAALEAEASAHEMALRLGRDPDLLRALGELHDQPDVIQRIAEDPNTFFEKRGFEVPAAATVVVTTDPKRPAVEAHFKNPPIDYGVGWSPGGGFYAIATPQPPPVPEAPSGKED